jgi:hypothetical protein
MECNMITREQIFEWADKAKLGRDPIYEEMWIEDASVEELWRMIDANQRVISPLWREECSS